jgi:hypothetical protein
VQEGRRNISFALGYPVGRISAAKSKSKKQPNVQNSRRPLLYFRRFSGRQEICRPRPKACYMVGRKSLHAKERLVFGTPAIISSGRNSSPARGQKF